MISVTTNSCRKERNFFHLQWIKRLWSEFQVCWIRHWPTWKCTKIFRPHLSLEFLKSWRKWEFQRYKATRWLPQNAATTYHTFSSKPRCNFSLKLASLYLASWPNLFNNSCLLFLFRLLKYLKQLAYMKRCESLNSSSMEIIFVFWLLFASEQKNV